MTNGLSLFDVADGVALSLPDAMPFEEWRSIGVALAKMEKGVQWWIGDWWAFGQHNYGQRAKAAAEGIFGRAFQTLKNMGTVARTFERSRRRDLLPYSHHVEVSSLPAEIADPLLDVAEADGIPEARLCIRTLLRDMRQ